MMGQAVANKKVFLRKPNGQRWLDQDALLSQAVSNGDRGSRFGCLVEHDMRYSIAALNTSSPKTMNWENTVAADR